MDKLVPTLFEDEQFLAVGKPSGVDVGRIAGQPAAFSLVDLMQRTRVSAGVTLTVVNRLARHESGVLLLAKSPQMAQFVRKGLKEGHVLQEYMGLVGGRMKQNRIRILASAPRACKCPPGAQRPAARISQGKATANCAAWRRGRSAPSSSAKPAPRTRTCCGRNCAPWICAWWGTGGGGAASKAEPADRTRLHLASLSFHHPVREARVTIRAPLPEGFNAAAHGQRPLDDLLRSALARRFECLAEEGTDGYRLLTGDLEGLPGVVAERYGAVVVLQDRESNRRSARGRVPIRKIGQWYKRTLGGRCRLPQEIRPRPGRDGR